MGITEKLISQKRGVYTTRALVRWCVLPHIILSGRLHHCYKNVLTRTGDVLTGVPRARLVSRTRTGASSLVWAPAMAAAGPSRKRPPFWEGYESGPPLYRPRAKRPVDKQLIWLYDQASTTVHEDTLYTATHACTVGGLRWNLAIEGNGSTTAGVRWFIVRRPGGSSGTVGSTPTGTAYAPESEVMAFGVDMPTQGESLGGSRSVCGQSHSQRKLSAGDKLVFVIKTSSGSMDYLGIVQFFVKE